jgi:drug/metabolite transporter (DMT)-like permease
MSLMPIMVIPVVWVVYKQRTGWRGIAGACIAIAGVAMLFVV